MRRIYLSIGHHARALADSTYASMVVGRLLLGLVAVLMIAMMWTERFLTWDKFLQGGQDLELSLMALVVFLCLIILLAQRSQQAVAFHLGICRFLSEIAALPQALRRRFLLEGPGLVESIAARGKISPQQFARVCPSPLRI